MKLIIPMAGMGKRMRPHTLTVPKPLIKVAGKSIVERLIYKLADFVNEPITDIAFIISNFGLEVEQYLVDLAAQFNAKAHLVYQDQPLGTAHAVHCAKELLQGPVIVAFADTLFLADNKLDQNADSLIWVNEVEDPSQFGVVITDTENRVVSFVEKPKSFVSNKAIIGIYYFKYGENLLKEINHIIDNNLRGNNEYQLTDALELLKNNGTVFKTTSVNEWLDCGNKNATVYTNGRIVNSLSASERKQFDADIVNSVIIEPCYFGKNVKILNSVVGPNVSLENNVYIENSIVNNAMINSNSVLSAANIRNSMIGSNVEYRGTMDDLNIGDFTQIL